MKPEYDLIVTRHSGLIQWLRSGLYPTEPIAWAGDGRMEWATQGPEPDDPEYAVYRIIPIIPHATAEDVRGKHVVGVLPLALAALAASVTEMSLPRLRPDQRGKDISEGEMNEAGAVLVQYRVTTEPT